MFHYGVVLILSSKMVYIKSKTVEPERESPERKYKGFVMLIIFLWNEYLLIHLPISSKALLVQVKND